jgi:hypothetical protein
MQERWGFRAKRRGSGPGRLAAAGARLATRVCHAADARLVFLQHHDDKMISRVGDAIWRSGEATRPQAHSEVGRGLLRSVGTGVHEAA